MSCGLLIRGLIYSELSKTPEHRSYLAQDFAHVTVDSGVGTIGLEQPDMGESHKEIDLADDGFG